MNDSKAGGSLEMNKDRYWDKLKRATPQLKDPETKMTISVAELKKVVQRAFEAGRLEDPPKTREEAAKEFAKLGRKKSPMESIFKDMFGG